MQVASASSSSIIAVKSKAGYPHCRCCLSVGRHRSIGKTEYDFLLESLNIDLLTDPRLPNVICTSCIKNLELIKIFRMTVINSQRTLYQIVFEGNKTNKLDTNTDLVNDEIETYLDDSVELNKTKVKLEQDSDNENALSEEMITPGDIAGQVGQPSQADPLQLMDVKTEPECNTEKIEFYTVQIEFEKPVKEEHKKVTTREKPQENKIFLTELHKKKLTPVVQSHPRIQRREAKQNSKQLCDSSLRCVEPIKATSAHLLVGGKSLLATYNNKLRANMIQTLQNSTILPFRSKKSNTFQCFLCDTQFGRFMDYREHTATEHKEGVDDYTLMKLLLVRQKIMIYADISSMKCKLCDDPFERINDLDKHLSEKHQKVYYDVQNNGDKKPFHTIIGFHLNKEPFTCHLCTSEFRFFKSLTNHMSVHYDVYDCDVCRKTFLTKSSLSGHIYKHQKTENKCTDCDRMFKSKYAMTAHRKSVHFGKTPKKDTPVKCSLCPMEFLSNRPMTKYEHMEKVHGVKRPVYKCDVCDKVCDTIGGLGRHKRTIHIRKNPLMCDKCGYVTLHRDYMEKHIDYHNGVRKYECDLCNKKFRTKNTIRMHLRGHYNDKRFACSLCDAAFIQKHCLKSHIKSRHPDSGVDFSKL